MIIFAIVSAGNFHKVKPDSYLILNSTATYNGVYNLNINVYAKSETDVDDYAILHPLHYHYY